MVNVILRRVLFEPSVIHQISKKSDPRLIIRLRLRSNTHALLLRYLISMMVLLYHFVATPIFQTIKATPLLDASQPQQINMAVIELEGEGISQQETPTLIHRLKTSLVVTGKIIFVERGMMENILDEVGFQKTGYVSTECAVEVGLIKLKVPRTSPD